MAAQKTVGGLLAVIGLLGVAILALDKILWNSVGGTHAYGLIVFVIIDFVIAGLVLTRGSKGAFTAAFAWSVLRILIMVADVFSRPEGMEPGEFANYLFNPVLHDAPNPPGIPGAIIDLILVLQLLVIWISWKARSTAQRQA